MKSVRIPSFSGTYFPALRRQSKYGRIRTSKAPNTDISRSFSYGQTLEFFMGMQKHIWKYCGLLQENLFLEKYDVDITLNFF